jgi:hypothetical protein
MNFRIRSTNEEGEDIPLEEKRLFKIEISDNGVPIKTYEGFNQITISHF